LIWCKHHDFPAISRGFPKFSEKWFPNCSRQLLSRNK
jgi:hypothetical protein